MKDLAAENERLRAEVSQLQSWKDEMMAVESEWDVQELAKMLGAKPGQSCRRVIHERVLELLADLRELWRVRAVLTNVATEAARDLALVRCLEPSDTMIKRAIIYKLSQAAAARITEGGAF